MINQQYPSRLLEKAVSEFSKLPGVGRKTALRQQLKAMGRIASAQASPDGKLIVYQVGYYSVKQNKSRQVICR